MQNLVLRDGKSEKILMLDKVVQTQRKVINLFVPVNNENKEIENSKVFGGALDGK